MDDRDADAVDVRRMREEETETVVRVWHESKRVAYPYLPLEQGRTLDEDRGFFERGIKPRNDLWVAVRDGEVTGFLAIEGDYVDRLYVRPDAQWQGIGSALIATAKDLSPSGVRLHTHQKNVQARAFYEKHGFHAAVFGISPPPESEPDIEYHWRPPA